MTIQYYKIKKGVSELINEPTSIESLLDDDYTVTKVIEESENKIKIISYSPKTRYEAFKEHQSKLGSIPF